MREGGQAALVLQVGGCATLPASANMGRELNSRCLGRKPQWQAGTPWLARIVVAIFGASPLFPGRLATPARHLPHMTPGFELRHWCGMEGSLGITGAFGPGPPRDRAVAVRGVNQGPDFIGASLYLITVHVRITVP